MSIVTSLGVLSSGELVIQRNNPHDHEVDLSHLVMALGRTESSGQSFLAIGLDLGFQVGFAHCVPVKALDRVFYGKRFLNREKQKVRTGFSKFTYENPVPTSQICVVLLKAKEYDSPTYILISSWYGPLAPPEPWDPKATPESKVFWDKHALTYKGNEWSLVPGTKTKNCPW